MKGKHVFLRWSLGISLVAVGAVIAGRLGWAGYLAADPTHITLVTLGVFLCATAWCGLLCWRLANGREPRRVKEDLDHGWFASSLCVSIGLIGTAVGYYLMLKHGAESGDTSRMIKGAFEHTSVAIINTVFGAVCGVIVEVQSHFIGHAANAALRAAGKPVTGDAP